MPRGEGTSDATLIGLLISARFTREGIPSLTSPRSHHICKMSTCASTHARMNVIIRAMFSEQEKDPALLTNIEAKYKKKRDGRLDDCRDGTPPHHQTSTRDPIQHQRTSPCGHVFYIPAPPSLLEGIQSQALCSVSAPVW